MVKVIVLMENNLYKLADIDEISKTISLQGHKYTTKNDYIHQQHR